MSAVGSPAVPEFPEPANHAAIASGDAYSDPPFSRRLRAWGAKSAWSLVDQGLAALTGFCATFLLARWMAPEIYGAYAIAFAGYLFVSGLHNVMVLEPMSVMGPSRHAGGLREYFRAQVAVHGVLTVACAVGVVGAALTARLVAPANPLAEAAAGIGLALPFSLFLFLARRMCYVRQRPFFAVLGSACCFVGVLAGLYALRHFRWVTPASVFLLVGAASLAGASVIVKCIGVALFQEKGAADGRIAWTSVLGENWSYGRWMVGSTILYSVSGQVQMLVAAAFLGLGAAGILRATMVPASSMTQVVTAVGLLLLPGLSHDFGRQLVDRMRLKAVVVSGLLGIGGICFVVVLWLFAERVEHLLFGGKYATYAWLMPMFAVIPAANGLTMGFSTALRASQRPHFDLLANAIAAPVAVVSAVSFIRWWGLAGAAASMAAGFVVYMGVNCWAFCAAPRAERKAGVASNGTTP
jgi:O-antigen/teichoic acid export membrane protein